VGQRADRVAAGMIGVGAVALFISTFLHWYPAVEGAYFDRSTGAPADAGVFSPGEPWLNAWEAFEWTDLLLLGCVVLGLAATAALLRAASVRTAGWAAIAAGAFGLALVVWRTVDQPGDFGGDLGFGVGIGAVLAASALVALAAGGLVAALARD
jgi:hypothetical protein